MEGIRYRITIRGRLSKRLGSAFDGMTLLLDSANTILVGVLTDQARLYGLLDRLRDFGLELVSLQEVP